MTEDEIADLAVNAALAFMAQTPTFIAIPDNSRVIVGYIEAHPELDPTAVSTYQQAFGACRDRLRFENQMSAEEYKNAVVIPVFRKKQQAKPQPSEIELMLKELFETRGFRDSMKNRAVVDKYMREHKIDDYSLENLGHAIETVCEYPGLELSDAAIARMPSHEYRKIVEREFRDHQAKQKPTESSKPLGVNWSNWLNGR